MVPTFHILTIHPQFVAAYKEFGVFGAAERRGLANVHPIHLRNFAADKHGSVDDYPFGGGDSMVLRPDCLARAVRSVEPAPYVIMPCPKGEAWNHQAARRILTLAESRPILFACGRFGGMDQRFVDRYVDEGFSLGEFVISGGELPALTWVDSMLRLIPGVLGNPQSATEDSYSEGLEGKLEYPLYTRPPLFEGMEVPPVLLSGDHKRISDWRNSSLSRKTTKVT